MYFLKDEKVKKKMEGQERRRKQNQLYVNATFQAPRCSTIFTLILIMIQLDLIIMIASLLANKNPKKPGQYFFYLFNFFSSSIVELKSSQLGLSAQHKNI